MRILKMPPWRALKAGVYGPWVKALRDQVVPRATDMSSRRAASEQSEATLSSSILFVIAPERALSPREGLRALVCRGPADPLIRNAQDTPPRRGLICPWSSPEPPGGQAAQ
jgi:hypothetical protein